MVSCCLKQDGMLSGHNLICKRSKTKIDLIPVASEHLQLFVINIVVPASLQLMDLSGDLLKLIEHGIYSENTSILLFDMAALYGYGNEYTIR